MYAKEQVRKPRKAVSVAGARRKPRNMDRRSATSGHIVTRKLIRIKAIAMASEKNSTKFKATNSWCTRFLRRKNFIMRQKTKIAQKLLQDLEEKITSFHRKELNYDLVHIGNMDETPVWFDMPSAKTVNSKGQKTVLVNTTGHVSLFCLHALSMECV